MKKGCLRIITAVLFALIFFLLSVVPAFAEEQIHFTAAVSLTSRKQYYVGDEVPFTVHVVNTGSVDIQTIEIYAGPELIKTYGQVKVGESVYIPVTRVFTFATHFGVAFNVVASSGSQSQEVFTDLVWITIKVQPSLTPAPTQESTPEPTQESTPGPTQESTPEPTQESTPEPTQESTPEPTQESTPVLSQIAALDMDMDDGKSETPEAQNAESSADIEVTRSNITVLYVVIAVLATLLLVAITAAIIALVLLRKTKIVNK